MPKKKPAPTEPAHACEIAGCAEPAYYKAPKSKTELNSYYWYCLDHVREYNLKWDYFAGMDSGQIENFIQDAVTGHRPTWQREAHVAGRFETLQQALYEFIHGKPIKKAPPPHLTAGLRAALSVLNMEYPYTPEALKAQYRALVKKHHPDVNKGNQQSEEKFKQVTAAYLVLSEHIKG